MKSLRSLVLGLLCSLVLAACQPSRTGQGTIPPIRMGLAQNVISLDPRMATDANSTRLNRLLYQPLVDIDAHYRPYGVLAASWQMLSPKHYRFYLKRPFARFADGSALSAADVLATYQSILAAGSMSPVKGQLDGVRAVRAPTPNTVDFYLAAPDPLFPMRLNIGIVSARALASGVGLGRHPQGSGPLTFVAWPEPGRVQLRRRRDGQVFEFITVNDPTVRVLKLQRGELDLLQNDLPVEMIRYLQSRGMRILRDDGSRFSYLGFNLRDPLTGRLPVREALSLAINRQALAHYLFDDKVKPAWGPMPLGHWAGPLSAQVPAYDPARAKRLLDAAGLPDPDGDGPAKRFTLEYKTSTDPLRLRVASVLQAQLARIGVGMRIRSLDWGTFYGDVKAGRFQLYSLSWIGIQSPDFYREAYDSASTPPNGNNRGYLRDATLDRMIGQALADPAQRGADYAKIQARLHQLYAYAPLWFEDNVALLRPDIRGYHLTPTGDYDALTEVEREDAH